VASTLPRDAPVDSKRLRQPHTNGHRQILYCSIILFRCARRTIRPFDKPQYCPKETASFCFSQVVLNIPWMWYFLSYKCDINKRIHVHFAYNWGTNVQIFPMATLENTIRFILFNKVHTKAQAVSRCPLTAKLRVRVRSIHVEFVLKWHWVRFMSEFFGFPLSISSTRVHTLRYITWGMIKSPLVAAV
jgi:hypothetical protein